MDRAMPASSISETTSWRCRWRSFAHRIPTRKRCMASSTRKTPPRGIAERGGYPTMTDPLAEDYLRWLVPQVRDEQDQQYWDLFSIMFEKEFESFIPNDDNRM